MAEDRPEKLRTALRDLETQLAATGELDDSTREQLADAVAEIAASLRRGKRSDRTKQAEDSLQNRLVEFEAAHPELAGVVSRLLDGLAQLGI